MSDDLSDVEELKTAESPAPLIPEVEERWSPRSFSDRPLDDATLRALLEAARWAPSSYNELRWAAFDEHVLLVWLNAFNRDWAEEAPALMLTVAKTAFTERDGENRHALHDVGLAMGALLAQATAMDVYVHQMAGILPERAREVYEIPDGYEVVAGVALGYLGDVDEDDTSKRSRKPLSEIVFQETWSQPAELAEG